MSEFCWMVFILVYGTMFVPIAVYLSAKLGSYGWLKGRHLFKQDHPES